MRYVPNGSRRLFVICGSAPVRHISVLGASESFFASLKNEMYHLRTFATRAEARVAVIDYVEGYYNRRRPHSTVGYRVPAELMDEFFGRVELAFAPEGEVVPLAA